MSLDRTYSLTRYHERVRVMIERQRLASNDIKWRQIEMMRLARSARQFAMSTALVRECVKDARGWHRCVLRGLGVSVVPR